MDYVLASNFNTDSVLIRFSTGWAKRSFIPFVYSTTKQDLTRMCTYVCVRACVREIVWVYFVVNVGTKLCRSVI